MTLTTKSLPKSLAGALLALAASITLYATPVLSQDQQPAAAPPADTSATPPETAVADAPAGTLIAEPTDGAAAPAPESGEPPADTRALDETVQDLKKDVVDLNRELFVLEEELLFPANTQVAVFVSMDIGEFFALDSLTLKIDNKEVANYLYTPREAEALLKGGVHRVYLGNLKVGEHQLVAFFEGKGPNNRDYKRGANIKFEKGVGAKYLELKITDRQRKAQPEFAIKDWE
ncbi:MAG TPA: hypothetical protein VM146_07330 [Steroidobacteraceae bacterium]|nr:hypothetical protein [Steroidobacteraceae bacterium]